jgi:DNA-binding NarL/FixJ family response regulator
MASSVATLSILLADDNDDLRRGVRDLLEAQPGWRVVGEAVNGREALEKATQFAPEVVILDVSMPELDGISAAPLIRQALPQAELLMLSQHDSPDMITRALDAGARGYVLKSQASRDLVPAVQAVRTHVPFLSAELAVGRLAVEPGASNESEAASGGSGP